MSEPDSELRAPKIMVITTTVGAGHNQAASAIIEEIDRCLPDAQVRRVQSLSLTPRVFRAYYAGGYTMGMSRFPSLYAAGFVLIDRPHGPRRNLFERCRLWIERLALRDLARLIERTQPDLIVNTHLLTAPMIGRLIAAGTIHARQVVTITDVRVHRFWYAENVHHWFVGADLCAEQLRRWGIAGGRITVCGMPVGAKWTARLDRRKILADWNLPADRPIVLLSGGTEFICGPVVRIARGIATCCPGAQVVVLAGRNKRLLARTCRLARRRPAIVPVGFTERLHELVEVCSMMVTKAGGIITAECLARSAPMVLLKPVQGQESGNAAYLAGRGAAVITRGANDAVQTVRRLLQQPDRLKEMTQKARDLYRPATRTIVQTLRRMLDVPSPKA